MPRVSDGGAADGRLTVPGAYAALFERESRRTEQGDPRLVYTDRPGEFMRRSTKLFEALSAGEPVVVPRWSVGGWTGRDERLRRMARADQTITGWRVFCNDMVTPVSRSFS